MPGGLHPPEALLLEWAAKANYVNPVTRGNGIPVMEVILLVLCVLIVALRVYTRAFLTKSFGVDDALVIFNLVRPQPVVLQHVLMTSVASLNRPCYLFVVW
jgi:hypothetical protein